MKPIKAKKYILSSALASFLIPVALMVIVFLAGFGPPESDSAEVQGFVFTLMAFPFIFVFQIFAYWVLGRRQLSLAKPSLLLGSSVGGFLALPLTIVVFGIVPVTGGSYWEAAVGAILFMFIPLWLSFTVGAATQYHLMVRA